MHVHSRCPQTQNLELGQSIQFRHFSQPKFLLHDPIACGLFNRGYNGGTGAHASWESIMLNSEEVLNLVVDRMRSDFENVAVKLRKPWNAKDVEP